MKAAAHHLPNRPALKTLGAYTQFKQLASFRGMAKSLSLKKNHRALNHLAGPFKALSRGRGMEFEDVRLYQAGDDVRSIDWRVTARVGKTHIKRFREEREVPVLLIIDQRQNMFFGSKQAMKSVVACDVAAFIAWAALNKGDRIGGMIFNDSIEHDIRPKQQRKTVLSLLNTLAETNQQLNTEAVPARHFNHALKELRRVVKPGQQIFMISDFHDFDEQSAKLMHDISRHSDITALRVFDDLEKQLPKTGIYQVSDGQSKLTFNSQNKTLQNKYQSDFEKHSAFLKRSLGQFHIPVIPINTADNALDVLQQYLGAR